MQHDFLIIIHLFSEMKIITINHHEMTKLSFPVFLVIHLFGNLIDIIEGFEVPIK